MRMRIFGSIEMKTTIMMHQIRNQFNGKTRTKKQLLLTDNLSENRYEMTVGHFYSLLIDQ